MAVNLLLSFAFYARENIGRYKAAMPCGRLLIDSGAFTASTLGKPVNIRDYAKFLETWRDSIDHAVTLDVIGDSEATRKNTHWLHSRGHNVMPVFTRGGKPADFDAMVRESGYVCVGGGVGMRSDVLIPRLAGLQRRAEELGGGIHALGVGNLNALKRIRPYSADASNVSSAFRFGTIVSYDGRQLRMFSITDRAKLREQAVHLKAQGVKMAELARTGRQPKGRERYELMQGMNMAYVAADEDTVAYAAPVPHGINDTPGTHLYSAVTGGHLAPAVSDLDTLLHDPTWTVPLWERYRAKHAPQCRAKTLEATPA